jgi:hypothetical protein
VTVYIMKSGESTDVERELRRYLKRALKTATRLVEKHPHYVNAIILVGILLSGLLKFACLRSCANAADAAATPTDGGVAGDSGLWLAEPHSYFQPPSPADIKATFFRLPLMIIERLQGAIHYRQKLLDCPEGKKLRPLAISVTPPRPHPADAALDSSRWRELLMDHWPLVLFLLLLLVLVMLGLILAIWMQNKPTQLQLVKGRWRYTHSPPVPAHYH